MTLPGSLVINRDAPPARTAPTDTGTWFAAGFADFGPTDEAVKVRSLKEFKSAFGGRVNSGSLCDSVETFFREGGSVCYVARVVGPAAANASVTIDSTVDVEAKYPGAFGNGLNVEVEAGSQSGTFRFVVTHDSDASVSETSPDYATVADAEDWDSAYVTITDNAGSASDPSVGTYSLSGGSDDYASATDSDWQTALDLFVADLGPGQVSYPGRTTATAHSQLLQHAEDTNRIALLDAADTATVATLTAAAAAASILPGASRGALFAPWAKIAGVSGGSVRTVPYSAVQAGLEARRDASGLNPNVPAAGVNGQPVSVIELAQSWTDDDRETLNDAGVNVAKLVYGGPRTYGYRTLVDPDTDPNNWQLGNSRLRMAVTAKASEIAERYVLSQIDGKGRTIAAFAGDLSGMLTGYYESGGLYGDSPEEAFRVDTSVNTPETIEAGQLRAVISMRVSPMAELVVIEIVKVPVSQEIN